MKKLQILVFCFTLSLYSWAQHTPWRSGEMEVKVEFGKAEDASRFSELKFNADINPAFAYAYLVPSELEVLKKAGFDYEILKPDLNAWSAGFGAAMVPPGYYTFTQIRNIADSLATHFPSICKKVVFGLTAQMQELAALKISDNVQQDENEPEIMFDGGIHGDEVGGPQNVIQFARDLCLGYGTDVQITGLVDTREIWLYYCVNPYGRDYMTRYNSSGVDINRDFCYMWGGEGNSTGPCSQLESKALRSCQYSNQFVAYTNYHSGTETISYPWSYRYSPAPDEPSIDHLASIYASSSGYTSLPYGQGSVIMYLIQGSTKDFNYGTQGSVAWSIEISLDKQPTNVQHYYTINKPAMLALIQHAGYGIQGLVTDAVDGKPVAASIYVGSNYPVYSDPEVGDFHKYLVAGSYTLKISANGYATKTIPNVVVSDMQCTTVDVQLTPMACQYAYKVVATQIPSFNAQNPGDEGYTAACLGAPDQVNYSVGRGGSIVIDMQDTILNGNPGTMDIKVYEGDSSPEGYTFYSGSTMDGPWVSLGTGTGTTSFDLGNSGVSAARYFKLVDDNNGQSNVNDAGFDLDAIACLHPAQPDTMAHLSGFVYNAYTLEPISNAEVNSGDTLAYTDASGKYLLDVIRGTKEICASHEGCRSECDTLQMMPAQAFVHDFYLIPTVGLIPAAEVPGLSVSPNPFQSFLTVRFMLPESGECSFDVYDLAGRKVLNTKKINLLKGYQKIVLDDRFLNRNKLETGAYILVISAHGITLQQKIVKSL